MGYLDFDTEHSHRRKIAAALKRRAMELDTADEWEIHGPHSPELPYQVYVGYAKDNMTDGYTCVAIYPRAVYEIEDPSCWGQVQPEQKIQVVP